MTAPARILLVEDEESHAELVRRAFEGQEERFRIDVVATLAEARARAGAAPPDLMITDLELPDGRGIGLLPDDREEAAYAVIVMTSHGDESVAVEAIKAGALDYVVKDAVAFSELPRIAERALREWGHILERRRAEHELRQRENELRHVQKMEAIGRLASGIAHDFNNVLMGIAGCADVALAKVPGDNPARPFIEEIRRSAKGAASIAGRLLAFARPREIAPELLDVNVIAKGSEGMLAHVLGPDVQLSLELAADTALVRVDAGQLDQVIMNLAVNARDAMPEGGRLVLATKNVVVSTPGMHEHADLAPGRYLVIEIEDSGRGMDAETQARAFEPFFTTKELGKGTGLGLSTVYATVQSAGGSIRLESVPGIGTTFRIYLPVAQETPSERAQADDVLRPGHGETVLLVEDEPLVRLSLRHHLEQGGYRVLEASDAESAIEWSRMPSGRVDLVVTDVVMPGGGGRRVAEGLRRCCPGMHVLYVSAHPRSVLEEEGRIEVGAPLIQKPFDPAALLDRVSELLSSRESANGSERIHVVVVEDNEAARMATAELLRDHDFEVSEAATGAEALTLCAQQQVDALVVDLGLPDVSGIDLVAKLRERRPELPVGFASGRQPDGAELARVLAQPGTDFVRKPVEVDVIAEKIRALLGERTTIAASDSSLRLRAS